MRMTNKVLGLYVQIVTRGAAEPLTRPATLVLTSGWWQPRYPRGHRIVDEQEMIELQSTITCPQCGHAAIETMPTDACQYIYDCRQCGTRMKPKKGDCCIFCSYGSVPCPPIQEERAGCGQGACCGSSGHG